MKKLCIFLGGFLFLISVFFHGNFLDVKAQSDLAHKLAGQILLQVQARGEAWYVYPKNFKRYYLGKPKDAFKIMRELGLGITDDNLKLIPRDSDSISGHSSLAGKLAGQILLQVQSKGEAWYVYPKNLKRYYLGKPKDAFKIMRKLGLGVTNENLTKISSANMPMPGEIKWQYRFDFNNESGNYPIGIIRDTLLILENNKKIKALYSDYGKIAWQKDLPSKAKERLKFKNKRIFYEAKDDYIYSVDALTGRALWKFNIKNSKGGLLLVLTDFVILEIDNNLYCLKANTGQKQWKFNLMSQMNDNTVFAMADNYFYILVNGHELWSLDIKTGNKNWKKEINNSIKELKANDSYVYYIDSNNYLHFLNPINGNQIAKININEKFLNEKFLVQENNLYYVNKNSEFCSFKIDQSQIDWKFKVSLANIKMFLKNRGYIYFFTDDKLYSYSKEKELWHVYLNNFKYKKHYFTNDKIYLIDQDNIMYSIDKKTGNLRWKQDGGINQDIIFNDQAVFLQNIKQEILAFYK
jgi:outer membrane protein assembly factor BamB